MARRKTGKGEARLQKKIRAAASNLRARFRHLSPPSWSGVAAVVRFCYEKWQRVDRRCGLCGARATVSEVSLDHLLPVRRGGPAFSVNNLCVVHKRCNAIKGMLSLEEWGLLRRFLGQLAPEARVDIERRLYAGGKLYR